MLLSPTPMHIPDGFLSVLVSILLWAVSIAVVAVALKRVGKDLNVWCR
jgi:cobalt/nickel transport system permease protein